MKKALTIEELKNRIGKPVFIASPIYLETTKWNVIKEIAERQDLLYKYLEFIDGLTITFENVNDFRFFDTEVSEEELKEILDAEKKTKKTGYERVETGEKYYIINLLKEVTSFTDSEFLEFYSGERFEVANYFNDKKLAENIARAEILKYKLRRYAALNGGLPSKDDWNDCEIFKYFVVCNYRKNEIYATYISTQRDSFQIYFKDINACKKAIEIFKDELIWYFTEFEEQLY
jgi:hypothetical protein